MNKVPLYLASASRDHVRVCKWAKQLDASGLFDITDRWFEGCDKWAGTDHEYTREDQAGFASAHEVAIRQSRLFWLLWPGETVSLGAIYELGYASSHRWHLSKLDNAGAVIPGPLRIAVSGAGSSRTIYTAKADYRDEVDELAFHALCTWAQILRAVSP